MKLIKIALFLTVVSAAVCAVQKVDVTDEAAAVVGTSSPPEPPSTTTTPKPDPTTTTTPKPDPTTTTTPKPDPTTTTTPKPDPTTTTTPKPDPTTTTTPKPDPKTTTTTTPKPTPTPTTTTSLPPTTPKPNPPPMPGQWIVKEGNVTCVLTKMHLSVNVTYPINDTAIGQKTLTPIANNPNGTEVKGICHNNTQSIIIPLNFNATLRLDFALNVSTSKISLSAIELNVTGLADLKANESTVLRENSTMFVTPLKMSYKCNKEQLVNLTTVDQHSNATVIVSEVQLEAFRSDNTTNFASAQDCAGSDTPDIVPIAVGVSLGIMIVVVLVAYLIGRRRASNQGYVSM